MKFRFDPNQQFQQDAISAVVDLFEGQPSNAEGLLTKIHEQPGFEQDIQLFADDIGAVGNNLLLDTSTILQNLQMIQDRNGLEILDKLVNDALDFDIEMETGTGKTYVYLRTIFELAKRYNFTKFIILVPSIAIKEGVITSIQLMRDHFWQLYAMPFDVTVYSGKSPDEVQPFATSTNLQIMIITIGSVRGNKRLVINDDRREQLNGLPPIKYLSSTNPVVIMDEPQNMESELSKSAIGELNPLCTLRYSATHGKQRNVVYRLDPVDAHSMGLVKEIVVADVVQDGTDVKPYIKLVEVKRDPSWQAKLELVCRSISGALQRKVISVPQHKDLAEVTKNDAYSNNWRINEISLEPPYIELTNHGILQLGEIIGGSEDYIYREMIRETIREHLRKEVLFKSRGIKVLSLFFVDKVAHYLDYGDGDGIVYGKFARWFDELFIEERDKHPKYKELLPQSPQELRGEYFASMKSRGRTTQLVDSTEQGSSRDYDAYNLIMRNKALLLDNKEPVRFIFSHSALREGWDNPNVFQICALREMGKVLERRQTIGRGLRLPVNQHGDRVMDRAVAQLTVVANESYRDFAKHLQEDYVEAGVNIGHLRRGEFAKLPFVEDGQESQFGYRRSEVIWQHLERRGFIDDKGKVLGTFVPNQSGFTLDLPDEYKLYESDITSIMENCRIEHFVKSARKRRKLTLNKALYTSPEFEELWHRISRRTTYRVQVNSEDIICQAVKAIKSEPEIEPLRIQSIRAEIEISRGGAKGSEIGTRSATLAGSYDLPDVVSELQEATSLTRKTLVEILIQSARLQEFIFNPNDFIQMAKRNILAVMATSVIDGVQYEQVAGSVYELRELQNDGITERDRFIDQLYEVKNQQKTDFDYIAFDSGVERQFAELLDSREDIKMFMKLPAKFKVPTPVGDYNPDWAILKQEDGQDKIYMIRETKSTSQDSLLRNSEVAKIKCGEKHFAAIGIEDYVVSVPGNWNL